ncbi:dockerin type I repeat-containing protein [Methylomonas sp. MK1]|uniref:dockerin type I repeat-containing protein n=1 Tax=Methylomonas sp. MK1 TaxID=1131552 RepID=UPI00039A929A|nr:dockerin type I repeat-containing protein [Methylomonas sp. MK1]
MKIRRHLCWLYAIDRSVLPLLIFSALLLLVPVARAAQQDGDDRATAPQAPRILFRSALGPRTSPFDPPTQDVFFTDGGAGLDTGCTFNNDPGHPLVISVVIDKFVGDVDANGYLVNPAPLVSAGIIPATVDIIMPAYDIDVNGTPPPERDEALFNGQSLGFLTGDNNIWKLNSFSVDIRKIKFPSRPASGGNVVPVINKVQINVDTLSSGRWCAAIDWVALVIPVRPKLALELKVIDGNKIRQNAGSATIDTIYQQDFDAACNVSTRIGPINEYPFSGPATSGLFGWFSGESKLRAKLKTCPENSIDPPEIKAEWTTSGGGPGGTTTWNGFEGDVTVKMPDKVGSYTVDFTYTINGTQTLTASRKLFVTKGSPLATVDPPRLTWYEKATDWASGQSGDDAIIKGVLDGLYSFGGANWRYGYCNFVPGAIASRYGCINAFGVPIPVIPKCMWEELLVDPITCNYSDCYVFSDVLTHMTATLGVSGLSAVPPVTAPGDNHFITSGSPSLDPAFRGSAKPLGGGAFDRYFFSSHSLVKRGWFFPDYYDATFDGVYGNKTQFIAFNLTGATANDAGGREYFVTSEGARVYDLFSSHYDGWGDYEYTLPAAPAPRLLAPVVMAMVSTELQLPGTASFRTLDSNGDGVYEGLATDIDVEVLTAGTYTIVGRLEKNRNVVANRPAYESQLSSRVTFEASATGSRKVTIVFSGELIYQSGQDGPYDLVLRGNNINTSLQTPAYDHRSFGEILTAITAVSDQGIDQNNDGKLEGIRADIDVSGRAAGNYRLLGALIKNGTTLVNANAEVSIVAGQQTISLTIPGLPLKRSGQDGPYEGVVSLIDSNSHTVSDFDFVTAAYPAKDFASVIEPVGAQSDQGVDSNGNGLYDTLSVSFGASFSRGGTFLLTGTLGNAAGTNTVFSEQLITVTPGVRQVTLNFAGPDIYGQRIDGPYRIEVSLRDPSSQEVIDRLALPEETKGYQYTDFDPTRNVSAITLTGASNDNGVDTDGNGLFNQLHVGVAVKLINSGTYEWSARLVDSRGTEIGFYTRRASLNAGNSQIDFVFDGTRIGKNGRDGPYFVKSLLMYGTNTNLVATDVAATSAYKASEFEGYVAKMPGDINLDGKLDQADVALFQQSLGSVVGDPKYNPDADLDGDGRVTVNDLRILRDLIKKSKL